MLAKLQYIFHTGDEGSPRPQRRLPSYVLRLPITLRNGDISDAIIVREYRGARPRIHKLFWQGDDVIILTKEQKLQ